MWTVPHAGRFASLLWRQQVQCKARWLFRGPNGYDTAIRAHMPFHYSGTAKWGRWEAPAAMKLHTFLSSLILFLLSILCLLPYLSDPFLLCALRFQNLYHQVHETLPGGSYQLNLTKIPRSHTNHPFHLSNLPLRFPGFCSSFKSHPLLVATLLLTLHSKTPRSQ